MEGCGNTTCAFCRSNIYTLQQLQIRVIKALKDRWQKSGACYDFDDNEIKQYILGLNISGLKYIMCSHRLKFN